MKRWMNRMAVVGCVSGGLLIGCSMNGGDPLPRDTVSVRTHGGELATTGLDDRNGGAIISQRSGMSGTASNTDDNRDTGIIPALADANADDPMQFMNKPSGPEVQEGLGGDVVAASNGKAEAPDPMPEEVFRPSTHYYVNGEDTGPSKDMLPGTGGTPGHQMNAKSNPM